MGSLGRASRGLVVLALMGGAACGGSATDPGGNGPTGSITLTLSSSTLSIAHGANGSVTATLGRGGGFTGAIAIAIEGLPANVTAAASPANVGAGATSSTITLTAAAGAAAGTTAITIRASGTGATERTATLTLTVTAPTPGGYTIALSTTTLEVSQGGQAEATATLTRTGGFTGGVAFSATGAPGGVSIAFDPTTTTAAATTITVTATTGATPGTHTVTIRASAAGLTDRTVTLSVTVTQASPGGNTTFRVCSVDPVLFAAVQDGDGPWSAVTVDDNAFSFDIASGRGGVAYVLSSEADQFQTAYFFGTQAELNNAGAACTLPGPTKTVNGSVANVGAGETAWVGLGSALVSVPPTAPSFTLENVPEGVTDLAATRVSVTLGAGNVTQTANRVILRRGLDPAANSTLPVLDFGAAEAVTPVTRDLTVDNLGADALRVALNFQTAGGATAILHSESAATAVTRQVPTLNPQAGDLHLLSATASTDPSGPTRSLLAYYSASADKAFTLGPPLGAVTVSTAATSPSARLRALYTRQPEYDNITVNYFQTSGATFRFVIIGLTEAYLAGTTTFDHTMADLSALSGWQMVWGLVQGTTVQWSLIGFSYGGTPTVLDGLITTMATRPGSITP